MAGGLLWALRVVAPLMIAMVLLQRGLRQGTVSRDEYEQRIAWLRVLTIVAAALFGGLAVVAVVAAIASRG